MDYKIIKWFSCGMFVALIFSPHPESLPVFWKVACMCSGVSYVICSGILKWSGRKRG